MMAGGTKEFNKTILQTSFTSLEYIYYLLSVVKNNEPMTSSDGKDTIFPVARARISQERGGEWSEDKRDTHAELTLREMKFIRYTDDAETTFEVSDVGVAFLDAFTLVETPTEGNKVKLSLTDNLSLEEKNQLLLDVLTRINVKQDKYGRNLRPYLILFKLLSEPIFEGYITKSEWSCFINCSEYLLDSQYSEIRDRLVEVREKDEEHPPKKSDRILTRLVLWNVLEKVDIPYEDEVCFALNEEFAKAVEINMLQGQVGRITEAGENKKENKLPPDESLRKSGGVNVLLYGVPGCGKSFTILNKYCKDADAIERVVFHPDYTYGDFVGQILPLTDVKTGKIRYEFSPGPFTRILSDAYNNPEKMYCLIVEEINRGNAPAIFGDVFQLLDRDANGNSAYEITNSDVANNVYISGEEIKKIKLPSNLYIFATMNTSDQNVFTLDTAFQRRWNMRMVENDVFKSKIATKQILDTNIKWANFADTINNLIITKNVGMTSSEDKRLGAYFVTEKDLYFFTTADGITQEDANDRNHNFPEKVLKYLWDDAFKFTRDEVFKSDYDSLEKLIKAFETAQGDKRFGIFADDIFELNQDE